MEVRQHLGKRLLEPRQVIVTVVLVVDDADIRQFQFLAHSDHVLGLAAPAAVVVDRHSAASLSGGLGEGPKAVGRKLHHGRLFAFAGLADSHPKRWF